MNVTAHINTPIGTKVLDDLGYLDYGVYTPVDIDVVKRSCATVGVWESATENFVMVLTDFDNPERVIKIFSTSEFGTETKNPIAIRDERGDVGDSYLFRNK